MVNLRWVLMHLLEETARHAGHADILRELVDGETGRVRLTTLTREFFMPLFLERDEAEREAPCELYPWDGVRNVRPFSGFQSSVVEGVY